jgi:ribosome biogenesis GTPase / thiamine phosphate phosphatase
LTGKARRTAESKPSSVPFASTQAGLVVAGFGRHVLVETDSGQRLICHPRGKKNQAVVGDRIRWQASEDEGTIETINERKNLFYRQDEMRTKSFASNLDQVLILMAAEPEFSENQLTRALIACEASKIAPLIVLNKSDLHEAFGRAWAKLEPYRSMGYRMLGLAIKPRTPAAEQAGAGIAELGAGLAGKKTLVLGPSGAGKSSLTNLLVPHAGALTAEISQALHAGKHTTTSTTLYWIDAEKSAALIDSPGFQEFGLHHIEPMQLAQLMPDLRPFAQQCRFYNCTHLHEPGCGVIAEVRSGEHAHRPISAARYRLYTELFAELSQQRY